MTIMTTKAGECWEASPEDIQKWKAAYPKIDVQIELLAAACWLDVNPKKRKTLIGMPRFCVAWLKRANDSGGSPFAKAKPNKKNQPTRTMSSEDMFSTDWAKGLAGRQ